MQQFVQLFAVLSTVKFKELDNMATVDGVNEKLDGSTPTSNKKTSLRMAKAKITAIAIQILKNITVEPFILMYCIGFAITKIVSPTLYMNKICSVREEKNQDAPDGAN